jgi:cbb3-type cytochrome oxidase subunit 3
MLTLVSTILGFASGGLPKVLDFVQDRGDKKHELAMMAANREREIALAKEGFIAQAKVEEIKTEQIAMQTQAQEKLAMWKHDMKIGEGASTWVINLRASVRPVVTYIFVALLVVVDIAGIWYAYSTGVAFAEAMDMVFNDDEMAILAAIIAFWFGSQAFNKK